MTHDPRSTSSILRSAVLTLFVVVAVVGTGGGRADARNAGDAETTSIVQVPHGGILVRTPGLRPELTNTLLIAVTGPDLGADQVAALRSALQPFHVKVWSVAPPTGEGASGTDLRGPDAGVVVPGLPVSPPPEQPSDVFEVAVKEAEEWALGAPFTPGEGRAVALLAGPGDVESVRRAISPDGTSSRSAASFGDTVRSIDAVGTFVPDLDGARSAPAGAGLPPGAPGLQPLPAPATSLPAGRPSTTVAPTSSAAMVAGGSSPSTVASTPTSEGAGGAARWIGAALLVVAGIVAIAIVAGRRRRGAAASRDEDEPMTGRSQPVAVAASGGDEPLDASPGRRLVHLGLTGGAGSGSKEEHTMSSPSQRVEPHASGSTCTWSLDRPGILGVGLWLEQRPGQGEDAPPTILVDPQADDVLVAVYDGVGGAGSAPGRERPDGSTVSSAFLAARRARTATEAWFGGLAPDDGGPSADRLHTELQAGLEAERSTHLPVSNRIAGSMRRLLPTTLAAVRAGSDDAGALQVSALWAGDSRGYVLHPIPGLQVLTVDDTPTVDALEALVNDAPLANMVCADRPFELHERAIPSEGPLVVLAATDGCFGYVATPAHFELLVLESLQRSADVGEWSRRLLASVKAVAADDASLALLALGWASFADLRSAFTDRANELRAVHGEPFVGIGSGERARLVAAREDSWERYRPGYHEHVADLVLAGAAGGGASRAPG